MHRFLLRERGVYALPDGRRFVAHASTPDSYSLFALRAWRQAAPAEYVLRPDGRILSKGVPTRWHAADLAFTGHVIRGAGHESSLPPDAL